MTFVLLMLPFVMGAAAAAAWLLVARPPHLRKRVIVNLEDRNETALKGVLWAQRGPWLVLRDVQLLQGERPPIAMDGEAIVHRDRVSFTQTVTL